MKRILVLILVIFVFIFIIVIFNSSKKSNEKILIGTNDETYSIKQNNTERIYSIHSSQTKNTPLPLVIVFHGGASNIEEVTKTLGWNNTADKRGFIVAYPQATGKEFFGKFLGIWNSGSCCGDAVKNNVDDVGFIREMIKDISKNYAIDQKRIYLSGISNGSMMALRVGCEMSHDIAAIGSVAGPLQYDSCGLDKPIPLIYMQGTDDTCAPYNGGITEGCYDLFFKEVLGITLHGEKIHFISAENFISKWKSLNKNNINAQNVYIKNNVICSSSGINNPNEVMFCKISGMGHTWPGQLNYGTSCEKGLEDSGCKATIKILGPINSDFQANEVMWDFFLKHTNQ